ncbi:MAG TPA: PilW family protein [Denitromonas sp.]|uniref:PilW family protein n=1 Tax=Denitromonas sp. TaxID=2734609 RepID=UPI001DEA4959|nr:PilW family protein [Rhodocyclaceae bacterium]MCP5222831.1 PilW family protein [Zoogloeaceae bacterium]HQU88254.1 PilW family protein [Denitromonas sp.]HQV14416.1 PilW family protein [Denitromonas sp.]
MSPIAPLSVFDRCRRLTGQRGSTLIELMIGMVISLLLVGGMITLFVNNKQTYRYNEELARIQEKGRFAVEFLQRNFRMVGHLGCGYMAASAEQEGYGAVFPQSIATGLSFNSANAISAYSYTTGIPGIVGGYSPPANIGVPGTDVITILFASGAATTLSNSVKAFNSPIIRDNALDFRQNDIVIIADCLSADAFRVSNVPASGNNVTLEHKIAGTTNDSDTLLSNREYGDGARVMRLQSQTFHLAKSSKVNRQGQPLQSLYLNGVEMVEGVANMNVLYGLPAAGVGPGPNGRTVTRYLPATAMTATDWPNVIAIQFELLLVSADDGAVSAPMPITFNGVTTTAADRRMYSTVSTTIALRNRL